MGGISSAEDAIEFFMAGANAIAVGTAIFSSPSILTEIADGINCWLDRHGINSLQEIIGIVK